MLQVDHIYEFLFENIFKDFDLYYCKDGVINPDQINFKDIAIFTRDQETTKKIFFYDQEPLLPNITEEYIKLFLYPIGYNLEEVYADSLTGGGPYNIPPISPKQHAFNILNPDKAYKNLTVFVTSEKSQLLETYEQSYNLKKLYYFFHGFAALDWYRGYYALNYNKSIVKTYNSDFISYNRIITNDRSYRIYFVSLLKEHNVLKNGTVSFNVTDQLFDDWRDETASSYSKLSEQAKQHAEHHLIGIDKLVIDRASIHGSFSADILRTIDSQMHPNFHKPVDIDSFWHIVTETVFYYDKLHLTEKIFKPIVSKQPFMLLAAPGNLAYLRSYGFKTFDSVIDESYDLIKDNDLRTQAVVKQLHWYCNLSLGEKTDIIQQLAPIINYNFHHFYGEFRHIITRELLDNTKTLFQSIGYDDSHVNYDGIYHVLTH